jgi:RNA polymerase sigma-70 factor, ECF subfamily
MATCTMTDISLLLERVGKGDRATDSELLDLIHGELHRLASACMRRERDGHLLQPTALVNEAYLRLLGGRPASFAGRAHFFSAASRVMRQILVDHARAELAAKRKGERVQVGS